MPPLLFYVITRTHAHGFPQKFKCSFFIFDDFMRGNEVIFFSFSF